MSIKSRGESDVIEQSEPDLREDGASLMPLIELDPQLVIDGARVEAGFRAADVTPVGTMRETCPYCSGVPLQMVLRSKHVFRAHLFCAQCTRCFDACHPDGSSALHFPVPSIY